MSFTIDVRGDFKALQRDIRGWRREQIPFATALALTDVAKKVAEVETEAIREVLPTSTPFTFRAFGVIAARKASPVATVFVKDIQERYLEPYLNPSGGRQVLGKSRAILAPIRIGLNTYGNIPRGKLTSLKGRSGVFIGRVKTRSGKVIDGVWQRPPGKGGRGAGALRLLIAFEDPKKVRPNLNYFERARRTIDRAIEPAFDAAMARAIATAR